MATAPIRSKNPSAMWGRLGKRPSSDKFVPTNNPVAVRWGSTTTEYLSDGLGQGNNIAIFPTHVQGICAQIDLWRTSAHYKNKTLAAALTTWSGGNWVESYIKFVCDRTPGLTRNTVMNDQFWHSGMALPFLKAQAWHESGSKYPAPDSDFAAALNKVLGGGVVKTPPSPKPTPEKPKTPTPQTEEADVSFTKLWKWIRGK